MKFKTNATGSGNIVIFRTGHLGDTVVSLPAIHAIRGVYPRHRLILLTPQENEGLVSPLEVLQATGVFSEVIFYTRPTFSLQALWDLSGVMIKLRRLKVDALFYLRGVPYQHFNRDRFFFTVICGINRVFGFEGGNGRVKGGEQAGDPVQVQSDADRLMEIVAEAGLALPPPGMWKRGLSVSEKECARIDSLWQDAGLTDDDLVVGVGPGSKMPAKRWPLDRFIQIGRALLDEFSNCYLVIVGGLEDAFLGQQMREALGDRVLNAAGQLSVLESAELLKRCALFVGNDSGAMHLANAVETSCVAIFSARDDPGRWEPQGRTHVVLRRSPPCAGCFLEVCRDKHMICLTDISVSDVWKAVQQVLACYPAGHEGDASRSPARLYPEG